MYSLTINRMTKNRMTKNRND